MSPGNSLSKACPAVAAEWHPTKNAFSADAVSHGSGKRVWWQCNNGHEWEARVNNRARGAGCPVCSGKLVLPGVNDLATARPDLALEWHPTRNRKQPSEVRPGSKTRVWWECSNGHLWQAQINSRNSGSGCPKCAERGPTASNRVWSLSRRDAVAFWHPRNDAAPEDISAGSKRVLWWQCGAGHEWQARVSKVLASAACPVCREEQDGPKSLAALHPELAAEWHPTRNERGAESVSIGSNLRVWWRCKQGHEWQAVVNSRRRTGVGCGACSNRRYARGINDLQSVRPDLADEWHRSKNDLNPSDVHVGTSKTVWWVCKFGHEWQSPVLNRVAGANCLVCAGRVVQVGFNDLQSTNPALASEWNFQKNSRSPAEVYGGSREVAWWLCSSGHEWVARIAHRNAGSGCPSCANYGFKPHESATLYLLMNHDLGAYKVGITNEGTNRLEMFSRLGWAVICQWRFSAGSDAHDVEQEFLGFIRDELGLGLAVEEAAMPLGGHTETFQTRGLEVDALLERMSSIIDHNLLTGSHQQESIGKEAAEP